MLSRISAFISIAASGQGRALAAALAIALALPSGSALARGAPDSFADLAQRLSPAVVNVSTTQTLQRNNVPDDMPFPPGSPFDESLAPGTATAPSSDYSRKG